VKNTKTTEIAIVPTATSQVVQPKPTKSEIIEALTRLKIEEGESDRAAKQAAYDAQMEVVKDLALKHSAKLPLSSIDKDRIQVSRYGHGYIEITFKFTQAANQWGDEREVHVLAPADLKKAWEKLNKLSDAVPCRLNYDEIRKGIRDSLTRDSAGRVSRLLQDVESRAALSEMLKTVEAGAEKRLN
jgi:hypothetical protein